MKNKLLFIIAEMLSAMVFGERSMKPGVDAFNSAVPADYAKTVVFSPFAFDLDCCLLGEALDPIGRANVSEKLFVMSDLVNAYEPVLDMFEKAPATNRVFFLSARTFGVPDVDKVNEQFRRRVFDMRTNASISQAWPSKGAERWFRAKLDGMMEDFLMPIGKIDSSVYSLVDVTAVVATLPNDCHCTVEKGAFHKGFEESVEMPFYRFTANAEYLRRPEYTLVRFPVNGNAFLYVVVPGKGKTLKDVRENFAGEAMAVRVLEVLDTNEKGCGCALSEISIPKLDVTTQTDMESAFGLMGIPEGDLTYLYSQLTHRESFQCVRFRLDEPPPPPEPPEGAKKKKKQAAEAKARFTFDKPFLFFLYIPQCSAIPVMGQFLGD